MSATVFEVVLFMMAVAILVAGGRSRCCRLLPPPLQFLFLRFQVIKITPALCNSYFWSRQFVLFSVRDGTEKMEHFFLHQKLHRGYRSYLLRWTSFER